MTTTKQGITEEAPKHTAKRLLLAMSPPDSILAAFYYQCSSDQLDPRNVVLGLEEQDEFADMVESCWTEYGPSQRYMKRLITRFVRLVEKNGGLIESDSLANLVAQASSINTDGAPDPLESCYVSFFLDPTKPNQICLRIRIFPFHNDVALRIWEAGNCIAEFLIDNPEIIAGKSLIELGSGCGATGLAIAACCKPSRVHLTDYTEACRLNLEHNLLVNQEWLSRFGFSPDRISQGYLEWEAFVKDRIPKTDLNDDEKNDKDNPKFIDNTMMAFDQADILIAADVIYDIACIDHLVHVVKCFLIESPKSKQAIFGITKRNMATFEFFLETIRKYDMDYTWLLKDEECDELTKIFEGDFVQSRKDVRICRIHLTDFEES